MMLLFATACGACDDEGTGVHPVPSASTAAALPSASAAAVTPAPKRDGLYVFAARRCSECHGEIAEQWTASAHARSASSALYTAMRNKLPNGGECERCHAPLDGVIEASHPAAGEGVACDACHTVRDVEVHDNASTVARALDDNTRYGTIADAKHHYFHRMGYAPLYGKAEYCAGCHHGAHAMGSGAPFSEYAEWRAGPSAAKERPCQTCHMPEIAAEVATGAAVRNHFPHHGLLGARGQLRKNAVRARARVHSGDTTLNVEVVLRNARAGHSVPTGLPERRLVIETRLLDDTGTVKATARMTYGRHLVDEQGKPAPFFKARRAARDDRLRPDEERTERFILPAASSGTVSVRVLWQRIDPQIARALGIDAPPPEALAEANIALGATNRGESTPLEPTP